MGFGPGTFKCLLLLGLSPFCSAFAQGPGPSRVPDLEEVVITGTPARRDLFSLPISLDLLDFFALTEGRLYRTLPEALREIPGVMVQKTTHGHGSPYIRGFTGHQTLLLIDGVRVNNSVYRSGPNQYWNTVDPLSLERVEILKGPAGVLYGSDAVGGTVQGLTRKLKDFGPGFGWSRRLHYRFSTAEHSHTARGEIMGSLDRHFRFCLGTNLKDYGNVRMGGGGDELKHSGYDQWDGDLKLEYDLSSSSNLVFLHQGVHQDDVWRVHKTIYGQSWQGTTVGSEYRRSKDQARELTYLQYHGERISGIFSSLRAGVSWHDQREERDRLRLRSGQLRNDIQSFGVGTVGAFVQGETHSGSGCWNFGFELYHDAVESKAYEYRDGVFNGYSIQGPVGDNATYTSLAAFVQDEFTLAPGLKATCGARYTWTRASAHKVENPATSQQMSVKDNYDAVVGSARLLWHPGAQKETAIFTGLAQGFRAPNLSDLTRLDGARSNEIETPAPDLDPETYLTFELGGKVNWADLSGQLAYFYTDIRDLIVRTPTGNTIGGEEEVTKRNGGAGYVHGLEGGGKWEFSPGLTFFGNLTWIYGSVDTYPTATPDKHREPLDRLMPLTALAGVRWRHPTRDLWAEILCSLAAKADKLSTRDKADTQRIPPGGTPGYEVFTLRGGWEFQPGMTFTGALDNFTNQAYRIHGSGQNEPGLNLVMGLNLSF